MIGGVTASNYNLMISFPRKFVIKTKIKLTTFNNLFPSVICNIKLLICLGMQDDIWSSRKNWQLCWACKGRGWCRILIITVSCRVWDTNWRFTGPICKKYQCCHCQNCFPEANVLLCLEHFLTSKDSVWYMLVVWAL